MNQQQQKKKDETPKKKKSTNPLMAAFKKDRNTPESLEKLRNDAALKSINKGRSNRGQKPLDKLPTTLAKASARPKTNKTTGKGGGAGGGDKKSTPKGDRRGGVAKKPTGTGKGSGGSSTKLSKNTSTPQNPLWGEKSNISADQRRWNELRRKAKPTQEEQNEMARLAQKGRK